MARGLDQSRWRGGSRARELGGPESSRQKSRRSGQYIGMLQVTTSPRSRLVGRSWPSALGQTCGMASGSTSSTMKVPSSPYKWRQQCVELVCNHSHNLEGSSRPQTLCMDRESCRSGQPRRQSEQKRFARPVRRELGRRQATAKLV